MSSPAAGARPDDDRRPGSTTPVDGAPRRPRRRRGGRGRSPSQNLTNQAASGVPAADAAAFPGGVAPDDAAPTTPSAAPDLDTAALRERIAALGTHEAQRLRRRLDAAQRTRAEADRARALATLVGAVDTAEARLAARRAAVPRITYPAALPVSARRDDIAAAIRDHQVVIVAGETGSGKTTQIPKICLDLGRGVTGMIGHTQPRRFAARTVADRIAEELGTELGDVTVGLQGPLHRPGRRQHPGQADDGRHPARRADRRPEPLALRHPDRRRGPRAQPQHRLPPGLPHAAAPPAPGPQGRHHLRDDRHRALRPALRGRPAPPCRSSRSPAARIPSSCATGRSWTPTTPRPTPTATRSRPSATPSPSCSARARATSWCSSPASARSATPPTRCAKRDFRNTEILPLYARLSTAEQHRVFAAHPGSRVVLATNVAETSLTVPGIRYVVDTGPRPHLPLLPADSRCSGCRSRRSARPARTSGPAAAAASPTASASGSTPRTTSTPARSSPIRRSCAPTWPR